MTSTAAVPNPVAAVVFRNMRALRVARNWSAEGLSHRTGIPRNVIANGENGRRADISVDELATLAAAFGVDPWSMTTDDPHCLTCLNNVPVGFSCLSCKRSYRNPVSPAIASPIQEKE